MRDDVFAPPLDRGEFPILQRLVGRDGARPLVYLDSAATALVPERVIGAVERFLRTSCANIHRGAHLLAEEATDAYEGAREHLASFFGVDDPARVLLVQNATDACNLAAFGWGARVLGPGDVVAVAEDNHHANIVCWQMLAERHGVEVAWIPIDADGRLDLEAWRLLAERAPGLVALSAQSNVLGFAQPDLRIVMEEAKRAGALVMLDGAQAAGHGDVADFDRMPVDFYVASAHKMMGLGGAGTLVCSDGALERMAPVRGGGGMIERVDREGYVVARRPNAFEAGTPAIAAAVAWSAALAMMEEAGLEAIRAHAGALAADAARRLAELPGVRLLGDAALPRESLVSFVVDGVHPHDAGRLLDDEGVMARAGHHCAQPLHRALGVPASVRASFAGYSAASDVDALVAAVARMTEGAARCA